MRQARLRSIFVVKISGMVNFNRPVLASHELIFEQFKAK
jgi:hypothetical protein